jgi:hypothetical protein
MNLCGVNLCGMNLMAGSASAAARPRFLDRAGYVRL